MLSDEEEKAIGDALRNWRQGDVTLDKGLEFLHLADLSRAHSRASQQVAINVRSAGEDVTDEPTGILDAVPGLVMLTQTCDIRRDCRKRPFVEMAALIHVTAMQLEEIRRLQRPAFAYIPALTERRLVADLDRTMTVEKALLAKWERIAGWDADGDLRGFALALSRKRSRVAFPDDFVIAAMDLQRRFVSKHDKKSVEGSHLRALEEIRVRAAPSWDDEEVQLSWWFIKKYDPREANWSHWAEEWMKLFNATGRFRIDPPTVCRLEDTTARDYMESDLLDLDRLSNSPVGND